MSKIKDIARNTFAELTPYQQSELEHIARDYVSDNQVVMTQAELLDLIAFVKVAQSIDSYLVGIDK